MNYSIPILFIFYNRESTALEVFKEIKKIKPITLFLAQDGPRNPTNETALLKLRETILKSIDWDCKVYTNFQSENLGCKKNIYSSINWFFSKVEMGIILEDDTVPNQSFFSFMQYTLNKFQHDQRISLVTGTNYYSNETKTVPYFMSEHIIIWGWGTWKRAWNEMDIEISGWRKKETRYFWKKKYRDYSYYKFQFLVWRALKMDSWGIPWMFSVMNANGKCLTPKVNLVTNIGIEGGHSTNISNSHFLETFELSQEELHKDYYLYVDRDYDLKLSMEKKSKRFALRLKITYYLKRTKLLGITKKVRNLIQS